MKMCGVEFRVLVILSTTLLPCAGCWEEVHYNPSQPTVLSSTVNAEVAEEAPSEATPEVEADREEPVADVVSPVTKDVGEEFVERQPEPTAEETSADIFVSDEKKTATSTESPPSEIDVMRPSRTALATWRMSSRWSLAAAIYAKGQGADRYGDLLNQANFAAELVGSELPEFPPSDGSDLEATVVGFLLESGSAQLADKLSEKFSPAYAALAEFAAKTHALLLVYTPKSQQLDPLIAEIRQAAGNSGLPPELWSELVAMLERREPFAAVKQQVLAMHAAVGDYLAGE